ncbi:hypothetical protein PO124_21705 [Bacillus licheniformis]|nr:hypothetical protein [Bacillus licheniformis]
MKFVRAIWPFVGLVLIIAFMSAFKYSDELSNDEKLNLYGDPKVNQQDQTTETSNNSAKRVPPALSFCVLIPVIKDL